MSIAELNKFAIKEARNTYYLNSNVTGLSNKELLLLLMEPITKDRSLSLLADELLQNGLQGLCSLSELELSMRFGLNDRQSFFLVSLLELGRRQNRMRKEDKVVIRSPGDVFDYLSDMRFLDKEYFVVFFLNTKNEVISKETLGIGSLNACIVHPREVFKSAIRHGAAAIICAHNHPSGDTTPSPEDIQLTRRLVESGQLIGIEMMDHLVVGAGRFVSIKEQGLI